MATRPKRVTNYMKNVGKSFGYAVYDVFSEYNPTLKSIGSSTAETTKEIYGAIREWKDNSRSTEKLGLKGSVGAVFNNLRDDIKTGNWYNKARQDSFDEALMSGMMGGDMSFDFNFDDEDWGDDWGDNNSSSDMGDEWGEDDSAKAMIQANHDQTKKLIGSMDQVGYSVSTSVNKGTITSANYVAEVTKAGHTALLNLNREGFSTIASALATVNQNINAFAKIAEPLTVHMQNSMQFYTNTSEALDKMTKSLDDLVKNTTPVSASKKYGYRQKGTFADIFSADDLFDPSAYIDMVKQNFKGDKELYDMAMNTIKAIDPKKFSPGVFLTRMMVGSMIPAMFKTSMSTLNETVKYAINDSLIKGRQRLTSGSGIGGGILGFLADYILPKDSIKKRIDPSRYEKGKVDWDGMSRKALMEVIPNLLSMIHSDISGDEYLVYDYNAGRFKKASTIAGERRRNIRNASNAAAGDFRNDIRAAINFDFSDKGKGAGKLKGLNREDVLIAVDKYFEEEFLRDRFDAVNIRSFSNSKYGKDLQRKYPGQFAYIADIFNGVYNKYRTMMANGDYSGMRKVHRLTTDYVKGRQQYSNSISDMEVEGSSTQAALISLSDAVNGNIKNVNVKNNSIASLFNPDKFGNTMLDYIRGTYQFTKAMFDIFNGSEVSAGTGIKVESPRSLNMSIRKTKAKKASTASSRADRENEERLWQDDYARALSEEENKRKGAKEQVDSVMYKIKEYFGINGVNAKSIKNLPFAATAHLMNKISLSLSDLMWGKDGMPDSGLFGIFKEKATEAFDSFKEYFQNQFKTSFDQIFERLFGKKNANGDREGGWFSELWNETKGGLRQAGRFVKDSVADVWYAGRQDRVKQRQAGLAREAEKNARIIAAIRAAGRTPDFENTILDDFTPGSGSGLPLYRYRGGASGAAAMKTVAEKIKGGFRVIDGGKTIIITDEQAAKLESGVTRAKGKAKVAAANFKDSIAGRGIGYLFDRIGDVGNIIAGKGNDPEAKKAKEVMNDQIKKEMGEGKGTIAAGAIIGSGISLLTGGIIGPLFGGALGAGVGLLISSKTARKKVFGEEELDEQGNPTGRIVGGFGPFKNPAIRKFITKELPTAGKGAIPGGLIGLILGGQFGMFGGMALGAGLKLWMSTKENSELFKDKILDKFDELFRNITNAVGGWIKRVGEDAKRKIGSFILKRLAKPAKERLKKSRIGRAVIGAGKRIGGKLANIPGRFSDRRKRKNANMGYDVYDAKLGRNMTAQEILDNVSGLNDSAAGLYQMYANASSEEEIDQITNAIDMVQNGGRYAKDNKNILRAAQNAATNYGYSGDMGDLLARLSRGGDDLEGYLGGLGLGDAFTSSMMKQSGKLNSLEASRAKAREIRKAYRAKGIDLRKVNLTGFRDIGANEKARIAKGVDVGPGSGAPLIDGIEENTSTIKDIVANIAQHLGVNLGFLKGKVSNILGGSDNGAQEGHEFVHDIHGTLEMVRDKNGNAVEDKSSSTNKEYFENKKAFNKAMDSIPSIGEKFNGLTNLISGFKEFFTGNEKKKGLFDWFKDLFMDEDGKLSIFKKFSNFFTGKSESLFGNLLTIAGGVGAIASLWALFSGAFNKLAAKIGLGGVGEGHSGAYAKNANGDMVEVDPNDLTKGIDGSDITGNYHYKAPMSLNERFISKLIGSTAKGNRGMLGMTAHIAGRTLQKVGKSGGLVEKAGNFLVDKSAAEAAWRKKMLGFGSKAAKSSSDDVAEGVTGAVVKGASRKSSVAAAEEGIEKAANKGIQEFVEEASERELKEGILDSFPKLFKSIKNKFGRLIGRQLGEAVEGVGEEIAPEVAEKVAKSAGKNAGKGALREAEAVPVVGWALAIGMAVWDFQGGWNRAAREFHVNKATVVEKLISGLVEASIGLLGLIPVVGGVASVVLGVLKPFLMDKITKALQARGFLKDMKKRRDESEAEYEADEEAAAALAAANGQTYIKKTYDQWNAEKYNNYGAGERIVNSFKSTAASIKTYGIGGSIKNAVSEKGTDIKVIFNEMKALVKAGDLEGLIQYQPKFTSEGISSLYLRGAVTGFKLNFAPQLAIGFVASKVGEFFGGIKDKITNTYQAVVQTMHDNEELLKTSSSLDQYLDTSAIKDEEGNPVAGLAKAAIISGRILTIPVLLVRNITRPIANKIKEIADKIKASVDATESERNRIDQLASAGKVGEILTGKISETDEEGNPFSGFQKAILGISTFGGFIKGSFVAVSNWFKNTIGSPIQKFMEQTSSSIATDSANLDNLANQGKILEVLTYKSSSNNPIASLITGFKQIGYVFKSIWNGVGDFLKEKVFSVKEGSFADSAFQGAKKLLNMTDQPAGGSSGFVSQIDPRYAGMDMGGYSFAQKGCGPAVASMITGMPVSDSVSASRRYMTPGGVTADYFTDVLGSKGIRTRATTNPNAMLRSIAGSGNVILLGRDPYNTSKAYSPFGPNPHYVVATGSDGHGNIYVNDPEMNGPTKYPASILRNAQVGIAAGGGAFDNFAKNSSLGGGYTAHGESHYAFKSGETSSTGTNLRDRGYSSSMDGMNSGGTSYGTASSVDDYRNENLGSWSSLTADQINQFIQGKNGSSPFNGNGNIFVKAADESGLDPRYILAHAAIESGWGTSRISKDKNNYFGIAAFDSSPYASAKSFGSGLEAGIVGGAKWIADHYYHGKYGQTSLYKMRWNDNVHQYATDPNWDQKIAKIMVGMPPNTKFVTTGGTLSSSSGTVGGNDVASAIGADMATSDSASSGESSSGNSGGTAKKATTIGGILGIVSEAFGKIGQFFSGGLQKEGEESQETKELEKNDDQENQTAGTASVGTDYKTSSIANDMANNFPYYKQSDSRWGSNPYGKGTIASSGCGPTSMAMVLRSYNKAYDPASAAQYSVNNGFRVDGQGTGWGYFKSIGGSEGLQVSQFGDSASASAALDNNIPVIASMKPGHFTKGGHYIVLAGKEGNNILVNDPNKHTGVWDQGTVFSEAKQFWSIAGPDGKGSIGNIRSGSTPGVYSGNNGYKYGVGVGDKYRTSAAGSGLLTYDQLAKVAGGSSGMLMSARPADRLYGRHMRTTFNGPSISPNLLAGGGSGALLDMINSGSSTVPNINVNADPGDAMLNILARILEKVNLLENISTNTAYIQAVKDAVSKLAAGDMAGAQAAAAQAVQSMNDTNEDVDDNFRALVGTLASVAKG